MGGGGGGGAAARAAAPERRECSGGSAAALLPSCPPSGMLTFNLLQDGGRAAVEAATTNVHVRVEVRSGYTRSPLSRRRRSCALLVMVPIACCPCHSTLALAAHPQHEECAGEADAGGGEAQHPAGPAARPPAPRHPRAAGGSGGSGRGG